MVDTSLSNWYQRKKKQVWGATLATAACVAVAYFAYQWLYPPGDEDDEKDTGADSVHQHATPGSAAVTENSRTSPNGGSISFGHTGQSHLERRLREQQATVQAIANQQTLPEMHGRLHQQLLELTGVENLTKDLRNLRPSAPPATASSPSTFPPTSSENAERMTRKLALWCDLRDQSFLLLVATTWLLPALTLIIHVQLTIIGRSTYLEEIVNSREMPRRSPPVKRRSGAAVPLTETSIEPLTPAQQQAFLSYGTFLLEDGLQNILPQIQKIVKQHVAKVDLQEKVSLAHLWQLLSQMHEDIDSQLPPSTWLAALLPPLVMHQNDLIAASTPSLSGFERSDISQGTPASPDLFSPEAAASIGSPCTGTGFSGMGETPGVIRPQRQQQAQCSFSDEFYPIGLDRPSADAVAKLVLEAQEVVASNFFLGAFQSSVKWCASSVAESLQGHFVMSARTPSNPARPRSPLGSSSKTPAGVRSPHQNQNSGGDANGVHNNYDTEAEGIHMATAAIVPRLAKVTDEILSCRSEVAGTICQLPAVRALLDAAFACGPFLDMQTSVHF